MANTNVDTGHGSLVAFNFDITLALNWTSIKPPKEIREPINTSHLSSTAVTRIAGDLRGWEPVTVEFQFDSESNLPAALGQSLSSPGTITITWPQSAGQSSPATLAGLGMITGVEINALQTGELQTGSMDIQFAGTTGPTFTKAT
jgi:hypothetical protein